MLAGYNINDMWVCDAQSIDLAGYHKNLPLALPQSKNKNVCLYRQVAGKDKLFSTISLAMSKMGLTVNNNLTPIDKTLPLSPLSTIGRWLLLKTGLALFAWTFRSPHKYNLIPLLNCFLISQSLKMSNSLGKPWTATTPSTSKLRALRRGVALACCWLTVPRWRTNSFPHLSDASV